MFDIFVEAFQKDGRDGFAEKIQGISHSEMDELISGLRTRALDAEAAVPYCRMLFSHDKTREMSMLLCTQLLQNRNFVERTSTRCLAELRTALMDLTSSARLCDKRHSEAVNLVGRMCERLTGFLRSTGAHPPCLKGHSQALELLPAAVQCLDILARDSRRAKARTAGGATTTVPPTEDEDMQNNASEPLCAASIRQDTIENVFKASWPGETVLPLELALTDMCLTDQEQLLACNKIGEHRDTVPQDHLIGLIQICLAMAEKTGHMLWLDSARDLLERTPEHLLGDAYCIVEMSLQSGSRLMGLLINYFSSLGTTERESPSVPSTASNLNFSGSQQRASSGDASRSMALTVADVNLMLVVAQNDLFRDIVMDAMAAALGGCLDMYLKCKDMRIHACMHACVHVCVCMFVCMMQAFSAVLGQCSYVYDRMHA
jgi:hypothetical protein